MKGCDKMNEIPKSGQDVEKILYKQLALLAEMSEQNKNKPDIFFRCSEFMNEIANTLLKR